MGLPWNGRGPAPVDVLLDTIAEPVAALLPDFASVLHQRLSGWVQEFLPYHAQCVAPAETETQLTRFNHLVRLTTQPVPQQIGEQLSWVWKALLGISTASGLVKPVCSFFPRDLLPTGDGWPSGLLSKTPVRNMTKDEKDALYQRAKNHLPALRTHLSSADGTLIRLLARSAFLLNPMDGFDGMPLDLSLIHISEPTRR